MSDQRDYAGKGELVPSGLRAYRHFKTREDILWPTIVGSSLCDIKPGVNVAECHAIPTRGYFFNNRVPMRGCGECFGTGVARFRRPAPVDFSSYLNWTAEDVGRIPYEVVEIDCPCLREHSKSPDARCSCGFYASYSPTANFFAATLSDAKTDAAVEGPLPTIWKRHYDLPPIFGVIEASGRCLMGSKGVRSERMEVKALAYDFEHARFSQHPARGYGASLSKLGTNYEVPVFDRISDMIEAFPRPDLSNLLKNQES